MENSKKIKVVAFDWDNVVVNSNNHTYKTLEILLGKRGITMESLGALKEGNYTATTETKIVFLANEEITKQAPSEKLISMEEYQETVRITEEKAIEKGGYWKEGILELMQYLQSIGIKVAIATNSFKMRPSVRLEKNIALKNNIDLVFGEDSVKNPKPDPEMIILISKEFNVDPSEVIFIDDSCKSLSSGIDCGATSIWLNEECNLRNKGKSIKDINGEAYEANSIEELSNLIKELVK